MEVSIYKIYIKNNSLSFIQVLWQIIRYIYKIKKIIYLYSKLYFENIKNGIRYVDLKRKHLDTKQECEQQHIGFEPLIMESSGGMLGETATLLLSL